MAAPLSQDAINQYMQYLQAEQQGPMLDAQGEGAQATANPNYVPIKQGAHYTPEQAVALYNNLDPALAYDPAMLQNILRGSNYWQSEGHFLPGQAITTPDVLRQGLKQWAQDDAPSWFDKAMPAIALGGIAALAGPEIFGALGGAGTDAAAMDVGAYGGASSAADSLVAGSLDAGAALTPLQQSALNMAQGSTEGAGATLNEGAAAAQTAGTTTSAMDAATKAVTDYVAKISPESIGTQLGQSAITRGVTAALQGQDPFAAVQQMFSDPTKLAENMALGQATGAATSGLSAGLQTGTGLSSNLAAPLASTAVTAARTGNINPLSLGLNLAGGEAKDQGASPTLTNLAVSGLGALGGGKNLNWQGMAANYGVNSGLKWVGNQMKNSGG